jgi:hypothetical protein
MEGGIIYFIVREIPGRCAMDPKTMALVDANRKLCICEPCPSYTECMRAGTELLFCVVGKSPDCIFEKKGCACPRCPVTPLLNLKKAYYCIRGTQEEQDKS